MIMSGKEPIGVVSKLLGFQGSLLENMNKALGKEGKKKRQREASSKWSPWHSKIFTFLFIQNQNQ